MKKFLLLMGFVLVLGSLSPKMVLAQAGFFDSPVGAVVSFNLNGTDVTTYGFVASNPLDIGIANTLTLKGAFIHTFKNGSGDICGGTFHYRVYKIGNTPPSFSTYNLPFSSNNPFTTTALPANITGANAGDQRWGDEALNANLLTGLTGGFYRLEFYFSATGGASGGCLTTFLYNNGGANYNIDFNVPYVSNQDGTWNNTATWIGGEIPLATSSAVINHNITLTNSLNITPPAAININATKSLTINSSNNTIGAITNNGTLTFATGGTATVVGSALNDGTIIVGDGTSVCGFNANTLTNSGTFTINPLSGAATAGAFTNSGMTTIQLGGAFAFNGNSVNSGTVNMNGLFTRGTGTFTGIPPVYAANSTLAYALPDGASITTTDEWTGLGTTVGAGTPHHVNLTSASGSGNWTLNLPPADRGLAGNLTMDAFTTLQQNGTTGNDLFLVGNLINNGTFTGNGRAIFFQGAAAKTISGTGTSNFSFLFVNGGTITYQKNIQINGGLTIDASTGFLSEASNARVLSIQGGNFINNGTFTANDGLVNFSGAGNRELQGSSTTTFNQVNIATGVDFVANTAANISSSLRILSGGFVVATQAPNYQANSTLIYDTGGNYNAGESWYQNTNSGPGVPHNVSIVNSTSLNFNTDASHRLMLGNLTIESSSTLSLSTTPGGDLHITGNFTNDGTFNGNERAVLFNGSTDQNLGGTGTINIDFLTVNKPTGKLLFGREITVNKSDGVVTLTSGDIDLNGNDLLLNGATSSISEDRANNHFITDATATSEASKGGRIVANARPVTSTETDIAGLGLFLNHTSTDYDVNISRYHYRGAGTGIRKIYNVTGTPTASTLSIEYANDELSGVPTVTIGLFRWNGSWSPIASTTSGNKVTATAPVTAFSAWTLGDNNVPLPVRLTRFEATRISEQEVKIAWQTASEQDNLGFEIQKSEDGQNFETIYFKEGAGNSSQIRDYQVIISESKSAYYRLNQLDTDGTSTLSNVEFVSEGRIKPHFTIYPNPTLGEISIQSNLASNAVLRVKILNQQGNLLQTWQGTLEEITAQMQQSTKKLPSGVYFMQLEAEGSRQVSKLVKH